VYAKATGFTALNLGKETNKTQEGLLANERANQTFSSFRNSNRSPLQLAADRSPDLLSLAGQFAATNPHWDRGIVWGLAILTTLLFFATIVIHELSHAAVAKARGLPVKSIALA
jgi:hypothetical protein